MKGDTGLREVPPPPVPRQAIPTRQSPSVLKYGLFSSQCFYKDSQGTKTCISLHYKPKASTHYFCRELLPSAPGIGHSYCSDLCPCSHPSPFPDPSPLPRATVAALEHLSTHQSDPGSCGCALMPPPIYLLLPHFLSTAVTKGLKCKETQVLPLFL